MIEVWPEMPPARGDLRLRSFAMGGFEGATMMLDTERRAAVIAQGRYDVEVATDYRLLASAGVRTAREAFRWHIIEPSPGRYDWSSVLPTIRAAAAVIWDLCH